VRARIDLDDLAEELGIELPKGRHASPAGSLLDKAEDAPAVGTKVEYGDIRFTVLRGSPGGVQEVKLAR
jgi:CBS domain containing-hemolysin-like protein